MKLLLPNLLPDDWEEAIRRLTTALEDVEFDSFPPGAMIACELKAGSGSPPEGWVEVLGLGSPGGSGDHIWIQKSTSQDQP